MGVRGGSLLNLRQRHPGTLPLTPGHWSLVSLHERSVGLPSTRQSAAGVAHRPAVRTRLRDRRPGSGLGGRGGWRLGPGDQGSWASGGMDAPASWALLWPWVGGWWPHPPSLSPLLFCTGGRVGLASLAHIVCLLPDIR